MNGQPPSVPPPPPPPAPVPPTQVVVLPPQGMGCFAKGCLTILILGFLLIAGVVGSGWYVFTRMVNNLTSTAPSDVRMEQPSDAQYQNAETLLTRLNNATDANEETTVEFTSTDLNALMARDEDFKEFRGRARVDIADSMMTISLSVPLDFFRWRRTRGRWFNGTARFSFVYSSGQFRVELESAEAGGHRLAGKFLTDTFMSSFNDGLNEGFQEKRGDYAGGENFWRHVKSISLVGDKMVVTTQAR